MTKKILYSFIICIYTLIFFSENIITNSTNFNIDFEPACEALLLVNLDTDSTIYSKNADKRLSPASITKIMTFIIVSENISDIENTTVTIKKELLDSLLGTGSSLSGIKANETLSINQLLHCLLIKSGNDAAITLADFVGNGDIDSFVKMMNEKAIELGCTDTHFMNPHGLHDDNHYTTATDLIKITKYAMTLPNFVDITSKVTSYILGENRYPLVTTNSLIDPIRGGKYYCKYVKGIKTGSDSIAGKCLVSSATAKGYTYLCVALGGFSPTENDAMLDSKRMYEWVFKNLELKPILDKSKPLGETKLNLVFKKDSLQLFPSHDCSVLLPKNVNPSSVDIKLNIPNIVNAPIKSGQKIGTATLSYANTILSTIDLVATEDINRSNILFIIYIIKNIFSSIWFKIAITIAIILIAVYIFYIFKINAHKKKKRKTMKIKKYKNKR